MPFRPTEEVQNASKLNESGIQAHCVSARPCQHRSYCALGFGSDHFWTGVACCKTLIIPSLGGN